MRMHHKMLHRALQREEARPIVLGEAQYAGGRHPGEYPLTSDSEDSALDVSDEEETEEPARIRLCMQMVPVEQRWANIYLHTFDSDLRFLPNRSPTSFTLFFQGRIEGQRLLPSIFCKVGVDGSMFFNLDSVKVDSYPS
jgi:hypothetical protein